MKGQVSWFERMAFLAAHPKGSYWWTDDAANPGAKYGGTWELLEAGRFLTAACAPDAEDQTYAVGSEGGSAETRLAESNLPLITGSVVATSNGNGWGVFTNASGIISTTNDIASCSNTEAGSSLNRGRRMTITIGQEENEAIDNRPPYHAAYCWYRTA